MIMFVALVLGATAIPIAANATSTGSDVVITDPAANPERYAKVDQFGKLQVGDNHLKTDILGNLKVAPQYGSVTATPALPDDLFRTHFVVTGAGVKTMAQPPGGKALIVTTVVLDWHGIPANGDFITLSVDDAPCAGSSSLVQDFDLTTTPDFREVSLEPGVVVPDGSAFCGQLTNFGASGGAVEVAVLGYLVPAGSVSAAAAERAPEETAVARP
jgi:hypothetical protein